MARGQTGALSGRATRIFNQALAVAALAASTAVAGKPIAVGQPAPSFTATTVDKQKLSIEGFKGQVLLLNLWATWCGPCKAEMPMMDRFYRRYNKAGFAMLGYTTEDSLPPAMLKKLDAVLAYPLAAKFKGSAYGVLGGVPTSYAIDRRGVVRYAKSGAFDESEFNALILPLLLEKAE